MLCFLSIFSVSPASLVLNACTVHCGTWTPFNSLIKKTHLVIKVLFFRLSTLIVFEYIFTGFLQFCGFGCNSIYKSCYKKPLCKLYPSFMCHLCGSVPEPSHAVAQLLGADALSQLFSHGFAGPGTAASENSPKGSICCVLVGVHLDPLQMWQF